MITSKQYAVVPVTRHERRRDRPDNLKTEYKKMTNREKFEEIFGLCLDEYRGYNDEFVIHDYDLNKFSCAWLDSEYTRPIRGLK